MRSLAICVAVVVAGAASFSAQAEPLPATTLPRDTHWIMHVDMDAVRQSPLWDLMNKRVMDARRQEIEARLKVLENLTGMKPLESLHDVTLSGASYDEADACLRIHASFDADKVTTMLKSTNDYAESKHNNHTVLTWRDESRSRPVFATLLENRIYFSASKTAVETALDALDGKIAPLPVTSSLLPHRDAAAAPVPLMVWIAAENLTELPRQHKAQSPVLSRMQSGSLSIAFARGKLAIETQVVATSDDAAEDIKDVGNGIRAMVRLASSDANAAPAARLLGSMLAEMKIETNGKDVHGILNVPLDKIEAALDLTKAQPASTTAKPASVAK